MSRLKRTRHAALRLALRSARSLLRGLPRTWALELGDLAGRAWWALSGWDRMHVRRNLRWVYAPRVSYEARERVGRKVMRQVARNVSEMARVFGAPREDVLSLVKVEGRENVDAAFAEGRGMIGVTGHYGCWELLAAWFVAAGYRVAVVGRRTSDPESTRLLAKMRMESGVRTLDSVDDSKALIEALRDGQGIGILMDIHSAHVRNVVVPFFGRRAWTPAGPAVLAYRTRAPVVPMAIGRLPDGLHRITFGQRVEPPPRGRGATEEFTARMNRALAGLFQADVTQWAWMHDRFRGCFHEHAARMRSLGLSPFAR